MRILSMILAGGTGKGLSALTLHRAKTALPFGGRYRIIDFCLSNCVHSGITDIAVLAQYTPKSLIEHIRMGKPWDLDRKSGGVYIHQPSYKGEVAKWYLGTADALYQNIDVIRESTAEAVLVLSGDQVYTMDYRKIVKFHTSHGKPVSLVYKEVKPSQRSRFGMLRCSGDGLVTSFQEKPVSSSYRFASLGIYLFNRKFLLKILGSNKNDIVFDIIMPLLEKKEVAGFRFDGYWEDVGAVKSYYRASLRLLKDQSMITNRDWPIYTRGMDLPPAKFSAGSIVNNSIIADGCHIRGTVKGSILFPGVCVNRDAVVENSILFSFARIGKGALIRKSIIDKSVSIREGARIGVVTKSSGYTAKNTAGCEGKESSGITVIGKGTVISRSVDISRGTVIEAQSRIRRRKGS